MKDKIAPYTVCIEEVHTKRVVIWADSEADAGWKAQDLVEKGKISMKDAVFISRRATVSQSDEVDLGQYQQYCRGCRT